MSEHEPADRDKYMTRSTWIPLGSAVAVMGLVVSMSISVSNRLLSMEYSVRTLTQEIGRLDKGLDFAAVDRWTHRDMESWVDLLEARNPAIVVPKVEKKR